MTGLAKWNWRWVSSDEGAPVGTECDVLAKKGLATLRE